MTISTQCILATFSPTPTSSNTTLVLIVLHLESNGVFSFVLENYELDQDLEVSFDSFKLTFQCMLNLFTSGLFGMVFEHFQNFFHPKDFVSGFL